MRNMFEFVVVGRSRAMILIVAMLLWAAGMHGCSSARGYITPGAAADFRALGITQEEAEAQTDISIARRLDRKPLARFPSSLAVVRVQGANYRSHTARGYGHGEFTVVTTRDVESEAAFQKLESLPMVATIHPLNLLVMPSTIRSEEDLRSAAANVQADMLLIYTFNTEFETHTKIKPLGLITLGLFPDRKGVVTTTASAALLDTRNGFVYGLAEATAHESRLSNAWNSSEEMDESRQKAEREAFEQLLARVEGMWTKIVQQFGPRLAAEASR